MFATRNVGTGWAGAAATATLVAVPATLIVPVEPSLHACHGGAIALSGLYQAGS
jgi:hypothetical protein